MITNGDIKNSNNKFHLIISLIGIIPIILIFIIYSFNNNSPLLHYIVNISINFPSISSAKNPLMSRVMSIYCKTAPLFGMVYFLLSLKRLIPQHIGKIKAIKISICSSILFFITNFTFLFFNHELTMSGRLLRLISTNNFLLLFFYSSLYVGLLMFTCMALVSYYLIYDAFKGRK